jgi:putative effector of murein hydrolase
MGESMPRATQELIPLGPMVCGLSALVLFPVFLRVTAMHKKTAFHRGFALGSVAHVSVMAALLGAGQQEAAEAAALAFFLLGTFRCLLVKVRLRRFPFWRHFMC